MKTFLLIDANALIHRAFHALPPLQTPDSEPIGAIYGLTNIIIKALKEQKPDYAAAAFDTPEPTFREKIFKEYKAHRPPTPNELISQLIKAHELFKAFGIKTFEKTGFEADDIIGTLVNKAKKEKDLRIIILTGDLDTLQLVQDEKIVVLAPKKGLSETMIYDEEAVKKRFGLRPEQMTDYKGLVGDPSDNIPGIKGVGQKTAEKILQEFHHLENLYQKMPTNHPLAKKILPHKDQALLSKNLATINKTVPLDAKFESLVYPGLDLKTLTRYLSGLGFTSVVNRLLKPSQNQVNEKIVAQTKKIPLPANVLIVRNSVTAIQNKKLLLSDKLKISYEWKDLIKELAMQNIEVKEPVFDLKIAGWLLDSDQNDFSLAALTRRFLYKTFDETHQEEISAELFDFFSQKIKEYRLSFVAEKIEMPLIKVLAVMEETGIKTNKALLQALQKEIQKEVDGLAQKIYALAEQTFNINSPKQVASMLFEKLAVQAKKTRKTATGQRSTDEETLLELKAQHPIIGLILNYRENFKIKTSFIEPLLVSIEKDGRVRTTYNQAGTATGRLASEKPNLQNIPQESKWSKRLRQAFTAEEGFSLLSLDYSQLELRLLAHVAQDKKLIQAFLQNEDVHRLTAAQVFNVPPEKVTPEMRRLGKTLNFGVIYGMGSRGFSLASGLPLTEAENFINEYFRDFPEVENWREKIKSEAAALGYVENLNGRRRWLWGVQSPNQRERAEMERRAMNMPIQSLNADIIKLAMIQIFDFLREQKLLKRKVRPLLSIHDELLFEVQDDILKTVAASLKKIMESIYKLAVPLKTETKTGKNWGEMKSFS